MMKSLRSILAAALLVLSGHAVADNYAYLTITQTGADTSFAVSEIKKITFDNTDMILSLTNGTQQHLPLAGLQKMFFSASSSGIAAVGSSLSELRLDGGILTVGTAKGSVITLYNIGGVAVKTVRAEAGQTEVNLSGLPNGVYVVKVDGLSQKIMKK